MHECAAQGCTQRVTNDMLMCKHHWFKVPSDIRNKVWATWRNVKHDRQAYEEARDEAIKSLLIKDGANPQREFPL